MNSRISRLAPIGFVAGSMGYLCWSHMGAASIPPAKAKPATTATDLSLAQLSPPAAPELTRDPFIHPAPPADEPELEPSEQGSGGTRLVKQDAAPAAIDVDRLVLNGTYVHGKRRMALINGVVYSEGQQVKDGDATLGLVTHVGVDAVELTSGDEKVALKYPLHWTNAALADAPSPPPPPPIAAAANKGRRSASHSVTPVISGPPAKVN